MIKNRKWTIVDVKRRLEKLGQLDEDPGNLFDRYDIRFLLDELDKVYYALHLMEESRNCWQKMYEAQKLLEINRTKRRSRNEQKSSLAAAPLAAGIDNRLTKL